MSKKSVGLSLLAWAIGMGLVILSNEFLKLPGKFTLAHVVGAACVGSMIDYLLFCRKPKREVHVCDVCFRNLKGKRPIDAALLERL